MDGNGSTLILDTTVKEYADDDFHSASIGGVFNLLRPGKTTTISNLTLQEVIQLERYLAEWH